MISDRVDLPAAEPAWGKRKIAVLAVKFAITIACFWYVSRYIDVASLIQRSRTVHLGWAAAAVLIIVAGLPLGGLRWSKVVDALGCKDVSRVDLIAITMIAQFFAQVLNVVGEMARVLMAARAGVAWRTGLVSVMIDRAVGIGVLSAIGFVVLLLPSALATLGGYRILAMELFGALIAAGLMVLVLAPAFARLVAPWRYVRWIGTLALSSRQVLFDVRAGAPIVALAVFMQLLAIVSVWCLGRALGFALPLDDAAVLFVLMVGVTLIPISFGGWGVREVAVIALLGTHGVSPESALFFSVSFGLVLIAASLPGALVWGVYSPARPIRIMPETGRAG